MTEPTTPTAPAQEPTPQAPVAPPWGENFDPQRAWHTIQTLREAEKERDQLRKQVVTPEQQQQLAEYQQLVEASKSEQQRKDEALADAHREIEKTRADAIRYKAAATFGVPQEHFDLLGSGTEEEVSARAEKIRTLLAAQAAAAVTSPTSTPPTRPIEQMRPGATPGETDNEEDVVFARLFGTPS